EAYELPLEISGNCVLVAGSRAGEERVAACVVRATTRADVNTTVRKRLDVRKASFLPLETAVADSGMAYGGITPIGLPARYRVMVDARPGRRRARDHRVRHPRLEARAAGVGPRAAHRRRGGRGPGALSARPARPAAAGSC